MNLISRLINRSGLRISHSKVISSELKTFECDILNPDRIIWRLKMRGEQALFNLEIKKKSGLSINPDIHHSKVFSSGYFH